MLDITNPQTITTGEGSGFAKVIPLDKFQPADTSRFINEKWKQYELENQRKKKLDTNRSNLPKAVVAKQERNRAEIANDYNDLLEYSVSVAAKGIDLTSDPEFMRREQALKQKVAMDELTAKKIEDYKAALEKDGTKYDQDLFEKRLNEYLQAPNMEETVSMFNQPWLVENVDVFSGLKDMMPNVQGYGALTPSQVEETAKAYIMTKPEIVKAGIARGIFKDEADALEKYKAEVKRMGDYRPAPKGGGGGGLNINLGGANVETDNYSLSAVHNPDLPYSTEGEANQVVFVNKKLGKSMPPQTLTIGGTPTFVQPLDVIKKGDGYVLRVQQAKRINAEQFAGLSKTEQAKYEAMNNEETNETEYVKIVGTKLQEVPFKRNDANWSVMTPVLTYDPIKMLEDANAGKTGAKTDKYIYDQLDKLYKANRELWTKVDDKGVLDAANKAKVDENSRKIEELRRQLNPQAKPKAESTSGGTTDVSSIFNNN